MSVIWSCRIQGTLADWIQGAFIAEVAEGDFYGTGKLISQSKVYISQDWNLRETTKVELGNSTSMRVVDTATSPKSTALQGHVYGNPDFVRKRFNPQPGEPGYLHRSDFLLALQREATDEKIAILRLWRWRFTISFFVSEQRLPASRYRRPRLP